MITKAQKALAELGDIPVVVPDSGCGCCRSYTYEPAGLEVERDVDSWDYTAGRAQEVPIVIVVS